MNNDVYIGKFKQNKIHGKGTCYYENGDKYIGFWEYDQKNGQGIYYFKNGDRYDKYDGEWK
jgi:hypothetical protein